MQKIKNFLQVYIVVMLMACALAAAMAAAGVDPGQFNGPAKWAVIAVLYGVACALLGKEL